jgi:hypothetical protein
LGDKRLSVADSGDEMRVAGSFKISKLVNLSGDLSIEVQVTEDCEDRTAHALEQRKSEVVLLLKQKLQSRVISHKKKCGSVGRQHLVSPST